MASNVRAYVDSRSSQAYSSLSSRGASLGADLASYNARAATPTSSPTVYAARVAEQASLSQRVASYNADAQSFASTHPLPPSSR